MGEQEQKRKRKKKDGDEKLEFEIGKVFGPEAAKEEDLDMEASRYKARKGEGGDRKSST